MGIKKITAIVLVATFAFALAACGGAAQNEENGQAEMRPDQAKRIIAIAPADFEIIYELGAEDMLVGRSEYCDYPVQGQSIESVGECLLPDTEKIIALAPDIVLAEYSLTKQDILDSLQNSGVNVAASPSPQSVEEIYDKINNIADITGKQNEAAELIGEMKEKMATYQNMAQENRPSLYYVVDTGEYGEFTATGDTFVSQIIEAAGIHNVAGMESGWMYTAEQLILDDPDYIIGMEQHIEKIKSTPQYANLKAIKNGRVIAVDINIFSRPTGRAVLEGIPMLREITGLQ